MTCADSKAIEVAVHAKYGIPVQVITGNGVITVTLAKVPAVVLEDLTAFVRYYFVPVGVALDFVETEIL